MRLHLQEEARKLRVSENLVVPVEASGKHVHLCRKDLEALFGEGHILRPERTISQPGQFVSTDRVSLVGPKGTLHNVAVLGPVRAYTQVEISLTDGVALGVKPQIALSGDLSAAQDIMITSDKACIKAEKCLIAAKNHLHMDSESAMRAGLCDGDKVDITINSERPLVFRNVPVRAGKGHLLALHIDCDEANACAYSKGTVGVITAKNGRKCDCCDLPEETEYTLGPEDMILQTRFLTEYQIRDAVKNGCSCVVLKKGAIVSPLAKDYAASYHVRIKFI
ncbi:MAG: phosphate propanoyltransferase [Lachnospiraceae bacterium]|nr:phosphate propanoyltransferase [Lachnospiraceae bacterium]